MSENLVQIGTWWNVWDIHLPQVADRCMERQMLAGHIKYDDTLADVFRIPVSCDSRNHSER